MHQLIARIHVIWLTFVALIAVTIVVAVGPRGGGIEAHFAASTEAFREALLNHQQAEAPGNGARDKVSIRTVNSYRAGLAADMLFLIAYGLLLRQSVRSLPRRRWTSTAMRAAIVTMAADAVENLTALAVLRQFDLASPSPGAWLFIAMPAAAVAKWVSAGLVLLALGWLWRETRARYAGGLRLVVHVASAGFFIAGAASLTVAAGVLYPPVRRPAATVALLAATAALLLQARLLDTFGRLLRFVFLTRVPLGVLTLAALTGPAALGPAASLLGGIIDVPATWGVTATTAACLVLAFACGTQINLVRAYAWQRMLDRTLRILASRAFANTVVWTALAAALSFVFSLGLASNDLRGWAIAFGVGSGLVIGLLFLILVEWAAALLTTRRPGRVVPQLAGPFDRVPLLGPWLKHLRQTQPPAALAGLKDFLGRWSIAGRLFGLASGYIDRERRLLPGHSFALVQLALSALFYGVLVWAKWGEVTPFNPWVPTAASVVLLLLVWAWGLAAIAFFVDRYRLPLVTSIAALALVTGSWNWTDHVVELQSGPSEVLATPGQVLGAFGQRPLVVAAAGGGIQAGAWAARVMQGLADSLGSDQDSLRNRLALAAGVSGGAMGVMYYGAYRDIGLQTATLQSMQPSLDEIAGAIIGPELFRIWGFPVSRGRGEALERSWAARLPRPSSEITLRSWAEHTRRFAETGGQATPFPAFLFNTTIVETGQAMAFATTQLPSRSYRDGFDRGARQSPLAESANLVFNLSGDGTQTGPVEIPVATAARLSAAFPYVSPAATLETPAGQRFHLVDGGYYDNYGLVVTSQWLDDALEEMLRNGVELPEEIGVVVIRSLVDARPDLVAPRDPASPRGDLVYTPRATSHGWAWQVIAPPAAFANGRTFGQWAGGNQVLRLLQEKWKARVGIQVQLFDFPAGALEPACELEPLSWKLTHAQKTCIEHGWGLVKPKVDAMRRTAPVNQLAAAR